MKLRIRGNSLRLRLNRPEVVRLAEIGHVEESICFGAGHEARLIYRLELSDAGDLIAADYDRGCITVRLPAVAALEWATTDEAISLTAEQPIDGGEKLRLLIEKDFACLVGDRAAEEDAGAFPHPMAGAARC